MKINLNTYSLKILKALLKDFLIDNDIRRMTLEEFYEYLENINEIKYELGKENLERIENIEKTDDGNEHKIVITIRQDKKSVVKRTYYYDSIEQRDKALEEIKI